MKRKTTRDSWMESASPLVHDTAFSEDKLNDFWFSYV